MSSEEKGRRRGRALSFGVSGALLVATLFPVLWLAQISLKTDVEAMRMPPAIFFVPTLDNYAAIFQGRFARSFLNSLVVSLSTTLAAMLLGVPAAYALSRASFGRSRGLALWVLTTRMAPPIAFAIPFFLAYRWLGLIDTLSGLLIIYLTFNLSLVMWMMRTFFDGIPLPLSGPGLATTAIFCFVFAWNDFFYALVLTRSRALMAPVAIVNFMN